MMVRAAAVVSHFTSPPVRVHTLVTEGGKPNDRLYLWKKRVLKVWERRLLSHCGLETCYSAEEMTTHCPPAALLGMLTFISSIRCNSSVNQPMFRETERAAKSPAAPIYSPVNFPPLSWSLMSSTSTSHPQHPSLSFIPLHLFLFPLVLTRCCERRCMIYEALFLPVTEEKERREATTKKRGRKKEGEEWRGEYEERAQGERGQESVKETSITPRPLGLKWRREVGWDGNMMDLTKIRGEILQRTRDVSSHTLNTVWSLIASNIILSITHFSSALFFCFLPLCAQEIAQTDQITCKLLLLWETRALIKPLLKHAGYCRHSSQTLL